MAILIGVGAVAAVVFLVMRRRGWIGLSAKEALRLSTWEGRPMLWGIVRIFQQIQKDHGKIVKVTSWARTKQRQAEIRKEFPGYAAKISPHQYCGAFDIVFTHEERQRRGGGYKEWNRDLAKIVKQAARKVGLGGRIRVGWKLYNYSCVHYDLMPMLFDKSFKAIKALLPDRIFGYEGFLGRDNPSPQNWRYGVTW